MDFLQPCLWLRSCCKWSTPASIDAPQLSKSSWPPDCTRLLATIAPRGQSCTLTLTPLLYHTIGSIWSIGKENNESRDDKTGSISNHLEPPRDDEQLDANIEPAVQSTMCSSNINFYHFLHSIHSITSCNSFCWTFQCWTFQPLLT